MEQCLGCLGIVFGSRRRRNRLRYQVKYGDNDAAGNTDGLEFENLFSEDEDKQNYGSNYNFVTKEEKDLVAQKQYDQLIAQQRAVDEQIREKTVKEEERIKYEEERFNEAQIEATRAAKAVEKLKETSLDKDTAPGKIADYNLFTLEDDSASDDDFEAFLESVKQRSEQFRSDKTSFCENIPPADTTVTSQPKKSGTSEVEFEDFPHPERGGSALPERDGRADGMSSDESFTYDDTVKSTSTDEWDNFVTGVETNSNANNNVIKTNRNVDNKKYGIENT